MGQNKKRLQEKLGNKLDLEQLLYEEEQIINAYENSVKSLRIKEKKIMSGIIFKNRSSYFDCRHSFFK